MVVPCLVAFMVKLPFCPAIVSTGGAVPVDPRCFSYWVSLCFSCPAASLRCSGFDVLGATAPERLASVLGADLRHGGLATIPAGTGLGVVPVPLALALGPLAPGGLELVLVGLCVAADPEPGPAQFNLQAVSLKRMSRICRNSSAVSVVALVLPVVSAWAWALCWRLRISKRASCSLLISCMASVLPPQSGWYCMARRR